MVNPNHAYYLKSYTAKLYYSSDCLGSLIHVKQKVLVIGEIK